MPTVYNKTPLLRPYFLEANRGTSDSSPQVFFKYESFQPGCSFKSRGIGNLILKNAKKVEEEGIKTLEVFSSSGGNAGYAAAVACRELSIPCTVVVPSSTKVRMVEKIRSTGAQVIVSGNFWKEADEYLRNSVINKVDSSKVEPLYVHPFDDPLIWEGHSTIIDEIVESLNDENVHTSKVKGVVCSIGGGGLYNGIIEGLERHALADKIPVIAVETEGCHVFNTCLELGKHVEFEKISSIATSLGSPSISTKTFEYAQKYHSKGVVLQDIDVLETCLRYSEDSNMIIEPACAASVHLAYNVDILEEALNKKLSKDDVIIIIACGGSATTLQDIKDSLAKLKIKN
ncbi:hypothetical protein KAFR_0F04430 [Kazachstania africana CBS 2517]|uniref:L-serine ammonia-lyase n=1 Tax=Kazachstania africana (strain ATCC 22294 / BCRC 22015 / CBS 2517 / CECT 1963 / NBRC 1671 / NRRL Y-8276) TaxID=1071382 RepID=H2AXD8_KAZAF|nr:hypothetical protein KAFR_0F04430 [Kazachstania africana CBS 2517]CCF59038.1 hypothetical protein KAFR_0F04430 [Kazachstania africana CBS 2517]